MLLRATFFLIFTFHCNSNFSQTIVNAAQDIYNTDNGLPSNGVKGLQFDEATGFLWIATEAGIVRFNGNSFKTFSNENTDLIKSERMLYLIRNRHNKIYTQDLSENVLSVNANTLKAESWVTKSNYSFILTASEALTLHNIDAVSKPTFNLYESQVYSLSDTSLIAIKNNTYFLFENTNVTQIYLPTEEVKKINSFKVNDKFFLFASDGSFFHFNTSTKKFDLVFLETELKNLFSSRETRVFWNYSDKPPILINKKNAYQIVEKNDKISLRLICKEISTDAFIQSVEYVESVKSIFLGTNSKGLIVIRNVGMTTKKKSNLKQYERNAYYSQIEIEDNLVLTNENHLIGEQTGVASAPFTDKFSFTVTTMSDSTIWFSKRATKMDRNCLWSYNKKSKILKEYEKIGVNDFAIYQTRENKLIIAGHNGIGFLEKDTIRYVHFFKGNNFSSVYNVVEYENNLLIASCMGLLKLNLSTLSLDTLYSSATTCVRSLLRYRNYVFFGTYGDGYFILKNKRLFRMPLDKNKFLRYVHCFVEDENGFCWMSTNRGLFKAKMDDLISSFESASESVFYHYYGKNDGLSITELNGGCNPCAIQLKNKLLSFPTMDGLLWVDVNADTVSNQFKKIFIDEIYVDEQKYILKEFEKLGHKHNSRVIDIKLDFPVWQGIENVYIEYKFSTEEEWSVIEDKQNYSIRFVNLAPGDYELELRKRNGFGENNFSYQKIRFKIATPWFKHWLFYFLCFAAVVGIIYLIFEWRTKNLKLRQQKLQETIDDKTAELRKQNEILEKNNLLKTRLISILSHDIVTPLKFLHVTAKKLHENKHLMPNEIQSFTIKEIADTSQQLQQLSTNILNWIKYQNENRRLQKENVFIHDIANQVFGVLQSLALQKNLLLVNNVSKELEIFQFYEPLKILIYNLVSNAINFSEKGNISVTASQNGNYITIQISDEGIGLSKEQINNIMADQFIISSTNVDNRKGNGLGYLIIKDLLQYMSGKLTIESKKNSGTTVSLEFLAS